MQYNQLQNVPGIFSAGLDIMEFQTDSRETLGEFWRSVQEMWIQLYGLQVPIVAAINVSRSHSHNLNQWTYDYNKAHLLPD